MDNVWYNVFLVVSALLGGVIGYSWYEYQEYKRKGRLAHYDILEANELEFMLEVLDAASLMTEAELKPIRSVASRLMRRRGYDVQWKDKK